MWVDEAISTAIKTHSANGDLTSVRLHAAQQHSSGFKHTHHSGLLSYSRVNGSGAELVQERQISQELLASMSMSAVHKLYINIGSLNEDRVNPEVNGNVNFNLCLWRIWITRPAPLSLTAIKTETEKHQNFPNLSWNTEFRPLKPLLWTKTLMNKAELNDWMWSGYTQKGFFFFSYYIFT